MLPGILRININSSEQDGDNDDGSRVKLSPSQRAELSESRRREYARRAREEHIFRLSKFESDAATGANNVGGVVDTERQYGLPLGEACEDVWEQIFQHVEDVEDLANLRDTCVLFRELLERKYRTLRFNQVAVKFAGNVGGFDALLRLRLISKSSKAAVDKFLWERNSYYSLLVEPFDQYMDEHYYPCASYEFRLEEELLRSFQSFVKDLELLNVAKDTFPIRNVTVSEVSNADLDNGLIILENARAQAENNPLLPVLRTQTKRLLELIGSNIKYFDYVTALDTLGTYNQLREWMTLMPNLEVLSVLSFGEPVNPNPGEQVLPTFPHCQKMKSLVIKGLEFSPRFIRQLAVFNPGIRDVTIHYARSMDLEEQPFAEALPDSLQTLQLESFKLRGVNTIPPPQFLDFVAKWPLKFLSLLIYGEDQENREIPSRKLFNYINSFSETLEELELNWKIIDTGGSLNLPKVTKLCWKLRPGFMALDFITALESLRYFDIDVVDCQEINGSYENVKEFVNGYSLPPLFPGLRWIRVRMEAEGKWRQVWKS